MKIIGIIAEYNPFHNGHAYQIAEAKKRRNADACVVIMSGDYVQRGEPAIIDKFARCRMALTNGADLVIELPTLFATSSAEGFALGAVSLLDSLGCIDELVFGAENDNLPLITEIARILATEPATFKELLQDECKKGLPYPKACSNALVTYLSASDTKDILTSSVDTNAILDIMDQPNNILAIQYIKALFLCSSKIKPYLLKRIGNDYHDTSLSASMEFASATGIRNELYRCMENKSNKDIINKHNIGMTNAPIIDMTNEHNIDMTNAPIIDMTNAPIIGISDVVTSYTPRIDSVVPKSSADILSDALKQHKLLTADSLSMLLHGKLILEQRNGFAQYLDVTPELSDKILKHLNEYVSFSQFCQLLKSKDLTHTRISRSLLHICLNIKKDFYESVKKLGYAFYVRPLGFTTTGRIVLKEISNNCSIPIISKLADWEKTLSDFYGDTSTLEGVSTQPLEVARELLLLDIQASQLYDAMVTASSQEKSISEYAKRLVIL